MDTENKKRDKHEDKWSNSVFLLGNAIPVFAVSVSQYRVSLPVETLENPIIEKPIIRRIRLLYLPFKVVISV